MRFKEGVDKTCSICTILKDVFTDDILLAGEAQGTGTEDGAGIDSCTIGADGLEIGHR